VCSIEQKIKSLVLKPDSLATNGFGCYNIKRQGNNTEKEVICPIIVLPVTGRKIDGTSKNQN
jgi:hypothetical protein